MENNSSATWCRSSSTAKFDSKEYLMPLFFLHNRRKVAINGQFRFKAIGKGDEEKERRYNDWSLAHEPLLIDDQHQNPWQ